MILEGAMIAIASISVTVAHPGLIFGPFWRLPKTREAVRGSSPSDSSTEFSKNTFPLQPSDVDGLVVAQGARTDRHM